MPLRRNRGANWVQRTEEQINEVPSHPGIEEGKAMAARGNAKNEARRKVLRAKAGKGNLTRRELKELERLEGLE